MVITFRNITLGFLNSKTLLQNTVPNKNFDSIQSTYFLSLTITLTFPRGGVLKRFVYCECGGGGDGQNYKFGSP